MITDWFVDLWVSFCQSIANGLPDDSPFDPAVEGANWEMFSTMNYFLPVSELLSVFAGVFLLGGPMAIITLVIWVLIGVVRGGNARA